LKIKTSKEGRMIFLKAKANNLKGDHYKGELRIFFEHNEFSDLWEGGYEEDVKLSNGHFTQGGDTQSMSIHEFFGCLFYMEILSTYQLNTLIDQVNDFKK
jgi:hypothetical protein